MHQKKKKKTYWNTILFPSDMQGPYLIYLDLSSSSIVRSCPECSPIFAELWWSGDVAKPSFVKPSPPSPAFVLRSPGIDGIEGIAGMAGIDGIDGIDACPNHPDICDFTLENTPPPAFVGLKLIEK